MCLGCDLPFLLLLDYAGFVLARLMVLGALPGLFLGEAIVWKEAVRTDARALLLLVLIICTCSSTAARISSKSLIELAPLIPIPRAILLADKLG